LKSSSLSISEEKYSKEVALLIDAAKSQTVIELEMSDLISKARDSGYNGPIIQKTGQNTVLVKLSEKGGYSYSYFNSLDVNIYPSEDGKKYVIFIK
jgi:hypothetical protein